MPSAGFNLPPGGGFHHEYPLTMRCTCGNEWDVVFEFDFGAVNYIYNGKCDGEFCPECGLEGKEVV